MDHHYIAVDGPPGVGKTALAERLAGREASMVLDRVGDTRSALKVARALGIPDERVREEINTDYFLDASVVIGLDYRSLRPFQSGD